MPIPDTPQTREEMYLNAAATGNTSGIPAQPYTRKEMYLDAIARNGGGGGSGGGVLVCSMDFTTGALDHTLQEILDAPFVVLKLETDSGGGTTVIAWNPLVFKAPWYDPEAQAPGALLYFAQYNTIDGENVTYDLVGIRAHATNPTDYPVMEMDGE